MRRISASRGEGLGNQFLANIREVGVVVHVVRCFHDDDVAHVTGAIDPVRAGHLPRVEHAPVHAIGIRSYSPAEARRIHDGIENYRGEVARRYRYTDGGGEIGLIASVTQPFCADCTRARACRRRASCLRASSPPRAAT